MKCLSAGIEIVYIFGSDGLIRGRITTSSLSDHQAKQTNDLIVLPQVICTFILNYSKTTVMSIPFFFVSRVLVLIS